MKKTKLLFVTLAMTMLFSTAAFAAEWRQDGSIWRYQNDDGTYLKSSWLQDKNGKWYFFNSSGYMMTGWLEITNTNKIYYLNNDGSMQTSPITIDGYTYTFDATGACTNFNGITSSSDDYKENLDAISRDETARAALYNWRESQMVDTTPGVNMWEEHIVSITDVSKSK